MDISKRVINIKRALSISLVAIFALLSFGYELVFASSWKHVDKPYNQFAENKVTISGDGVHQTAELTLAQLETMTEGVFEGVFTMRTLVEPHHSNYQGIRLDYLLKNVVGIKDSAQSISISCADGVSMDFALEDMINKQYVNEVDTNKLPVILAYGKEQLPLVSDSKDAGYNSKVRNDGGPLRLMVGQEKQGDHNSPKCLQNVTKIVVSTQQNTVSFTDVGRFYSWARESINNLANRGIINGVSPGKFAPDQDLTRAQFAKILTMALELNPIDVTTSRFLDVSPSDWHAAYVVRAAEKGLIGGYPDGTFKPDQPVSRLEVVVMVVRAMGLQDTAASNSNATPYQDMADIPQWAINSVLMATDKGLLDNIAVGYFNGTRNVNRAEAAVVIDRMIKDLEGGGR